jgi:glycosyltransferase involved in cell wall biosynthesis
MIPVSVVIITYNEVRNIARSVKRAQLISDDIIIVDSGSTDGTLQVANHLCPTVLETAWHGYGLNKNKGIDTAKYDWIFSLDADELPDFELISFLHTIDYNDIRSVYDFNFKVYFKNKLIRYGSWGCNHQVRLFNRAYGRWSSTRVHETLLFSGNINVKRSAGSVHHYSVNSIAEYYLKTENYAKLSALKYFDDRKQSTFVKLYLSPAFNFIWNYVFRFGFLDGKEGWIIARTSAWYTWRKYAYLAELNTIDNPNILAEKRIQI